MVIINFKEMLLVKKEMLLKLLDPIPCDKEIFLNELSSEGSPNLKLIRSVRYDETLEAWLIE
jgi:hypothetical protein